MQSSLIGRFMFSAPLRELAAFTNHSLKSGVKYVRHVHPVFTSFAQLAFVIYSFDARDCVMLGTGTLCLKRELLHRQRHTPRSYSLPCEHDA